MVAKLRIAGTGVLVAALVATVTQVLTATPAQAADDTILIHSHPLAQAPAAPPLKVVQNIGTGTITVTNPGGTAPTTQKCVEGVTDALFCLGTSDQLVYPDQTTNLGPITISNAPTRPDLPGAGMDWVIDEARAHVADIHGVRADDLVGTYARAEIRALVDSRLREILNKKLYGQPLTDQENAAYGVMAEFYKAKLVSKAKQSLTEYNLWTANPCTYPVPAPPSAKFPAVPNPVAGTPTCGAGGGITALFKYTSNTPPVSTFDTWASYRNPTPGMKHTGNANYEQMLSESMNAAYTLGSLGAAIAVVGAAHVAITTMNLALIAIYTAEHGGPLFLAAGGVAVVFAAVAIAIIIAGIAIYQIIEDNKPGEEIRHRVTDALGNNDPFGIEASKPAYVGMDYETLQDPSNAPKAAIHDFDFEKAQTAQVNEWMMFDGTGTLIVDPTGGFNEAGDVEPDDLRFYDADDNVKNPLVVLAPPGTKDAQGNTISGYLVKIHRGWLMVSTRLLGQSVGGPFRPRLYLRYDDGSPSGSAMMTLYRDGEPGEPQKTRFSITRKHPVSGVQVNEVSDTWALQSLGDVATTVHLEQGEPKLPEISVVPSVQGTMVADNLVQLQSNLSGPGLGTGGTFDWTVERLDDAGAVVETVTLPEGNLTGFQKRLANPGRYRAQVEYSYADPTPRTASGRVEFTIEAPEPEILTAEVKDDRVLNGSLSLDLRMLQNTHDDTFDVKVEWADDAHGNTIVENYTVQCEDAGSDTCDTGPLVTPEAAPTNANWSESPTYLIPADQNYLPHVTVTITNSYGLVMERVFPITGEHRPTYADNTPSVVAPVGTEFSVDLVEVFPSNLLVEDPDLTILPYGQQIVDQLPPGAHPDIEKRNGHWYLQIGGEVSSDAIGSYTFYYPFEQEPNGSGLRPPPALATVEFRAAVDPGYRSILRNVPTSLDNRDYRNVYPNYRVQVAQVLEDGQNTYAAFTGTVKCRFEANGKVIFDKPCQQDKTFPWPEDPYSGSVFATTYVQSATQPVSTDLPYKVNLVTDFVDGTVLSAPTAPEALTRKFELRVDDHVLPLQPPFFPLGYSISCSQDGKAYAPCFTNSTGSMTLHRVPGNHTLDVKVVAPDGQQEIERFGWAVTLAAKTLGMTVSHKTKKRGTKVTVAGKLLLPGESYKIKIGGIVLATGKAGNLGGFTRSITIPKALDARRHAVEIVGGKATRKALRYLTVTR